VGIVSLTNKGAVVSTNFFIAGLKQPVKRGEDGFVDDPLLAGVVGTVVNSDEVIEGFDEFGFGLGGVEVGRCRRYGLRPLCFLFLSLS
jgi:hypothetical protein